MTVTEEQVMPLVTEGLAELRRIATLRQCGRMPSVLSVRRSQRRCEDSRRWNVRDKLCCMMMSLCLTGASVPMRRTLRSALRMSVMLAIGHR